MTPEIAKTLCAVFLGIQIILFLVLYRFKKLEKYHPYFYMEGTVLIIAAMIFLSLDNRLFTCDHDTDYYLIELAIDAGCELVAFLIMFIIRKVLARNKNAGEITTTEEK